MRRRLPLVLTTLLLGGFMAAGCKSAAKTHEVTPALRGSLAGHAVSVVDPAVWTDLHAFYSQRAEEPAWVNRHRPTEHAWTIPDTIATDETAPAIKRDPGYLARQNIEVLRTIDRISGLPVHIGSVLGPSAYEPQPR